MIWGRCEGKARDGRAWVATYEEDHAEQQARGHQDREQEQPA